MDQTAVFEAVYATPFEEPVALMDQGWLPLLLSCEEAVLKAAMGDLGPELRNLALDLDLDHPHVGKFQNGIFFDSDMHETIFDTLNVAKNSLMEGYHAFLELLPDVMRRYFKRKNANKIVQAGRQFVRGMKSADKRNELRRERRATPISLITAASKGDGYRFGLPNDFSMYLFQNTAYQKVVEQAKQRAKRYADLGCKSLYSQILKSIDQFETQFKETHHGFHRIKMIDAALILAKLNGLEESHLEISADSGCWQLVDQTSGRLCEPWQCPIHQTNLKTFPKFSKFIQFLEAFPAVGGKPIFDHYLCIVPVIHPREEVASVLLGEVDGKCYYLCLGEKQMVDTLLHDEDIPF